VKHLTKGVVETREGKMSCEANLSESFRQVRRIRQLQPQGVFGTNYYIGKNRRTDEGIMENVWVIVLKDRRAVIRATNTFAKEAPRKILEPQGKETPSARMPTIRGPALGSLK